MDILLMRFDAPLMSFGGVLVDEHGVTDLFPSLSMLAGLLGNALGYRHADADALQSLQDRIEFAARWDVRPMPLVDFQTVDITPPLMQVGWTTKGKPEGRTCGTKTETVRRREHFHAGGLMTVALSLRGEGSPDVADLARALREPARPLFVGRKTCLPAEPILRGVVEARDVLEALRAASFEGRASPGPRAACWPKGLGLDLRSHEVEVYDRRVWRTQLHTGARRRREGLLPEECRS